MMRLQKRFLSPSGGRKPGVFREKFAKTDHFQNHPLKNCENKHNKGI